MRRLPIEGTVLEVSDRGAGEPVVLVQTALTADELRPLAEQPTLSGFRTVLFTGADTRAAARPRVPDRSAATPPTVAPY